MPVCQNLNGKNPRLSGAGPDVVQTSKGLDAADFAFGIGADLVDRQIRTAHFLFFRKAQANHLVEEAINRKTNCCSIGCAAKAADKLRRERHPAHAAKRGLAENAGCNAAPETAKSV